jgi:malonyl-CoA/methylmalonyl-CoA synthetase
MISWGELWERVQRTAPYFNHELGAQEQQAVSILLPNSIDFIVTYLAVLHSGHIALPLDPAYKKLELEAIIEQIDTNLLITDKKYGDQLDAGQTRIAHLDQLSDKHSSKVKPLRLPASEQIASLTFTSGTTGMPKTVPNTHANHIWNIEACSQVWDWTANDTLLVSLPLSHMHGIVICLSGAIYHANTMYLQQWFDAKDTLEALSTGRITMFTHAASAYVKLVQAENKDYDLSGVRLCISGAAPLPPAVWQEFKNRYGIEILETYGSSETGRIAGNRLDERLLGSPGKPLPGVSIRLSKDNELEVRSPGVFPGYYRNPQATRASLSADGYWRTGDIAELHDGYIYLKGRAQERIRRFGYTISPRDVEWAMLKDPGIKDIYVMGRQQTGEPNDQLIYFIVTELDDDQINKFCKENLLFAWRPDRIIRLNELPRTRSGKIRIGELKLILGGTA